MDSIHAVEQCNDILRLQEKLNCTSCHVLREELDALKEALQSEKVSHQHTCSTLERERDRARLAEAELAILKRQLDREKATFENAFGLLKSRAISDSSKDEDLLAKCSALEALCARKDEELVCQEQTILQLQYRLKAVEERHCHELMEFQVRAQQDAYVARYVGRQDRTQKRAK